MCLFGGGSPRIEFACCSLQSGNLEEEEEEEEEEGFFPDGVVLFLVAFPSRPTQTKGMPSKRLWCPFPPCLSSLVSRGSPCDCWKRRIRARCRLGAGIQDPLEIQVSQLGSAGKSGPSLRKGPPKTRIPGFPAWFPGQLVSIDVGGVSGTQALSGWF